MTTVQQNQTAEWCFSSRKTHGDPLNDITLDACFTGPDGREQLAPAFWVGGREWKVRFSSPTPGAYRFGTVCSDASDAGLHGQLRKVTGLDPGSPYRARLFNPITGVEEDRGEIRRDADGHWAPSFSKLPLFPFPVYQDWVIVLEAPGARLA